MSMFPNYKIGPQAMKFFELGYKAHAEGDFEQAIVYYKKSLEIELTAEAYTFLGWACSYMNRLAEAIDYCHKAIAIDPEFGNPYNDIGAYLIQAGDFEAAVPWLKRAKEAPRYDTPEYAFCNLGKVYELMALWPLALKEYQGALQHCGDYLPAREALERLKSYLN